jgi:GNAT superfamily N-acetyltransferase
MAEFYAEGGYKLDRQCAAGAFAAVLAKERLGYVWIIEEGHREVGHAVLTIKYAMEYGGLVACLDDLYVVPSSRNKGLSRNALFEIKRFCEAASIRAITIEVGYENGPAQAVYRRVGFAEAVDRQVLALPLAAPAHIL